MKVIEKDQRSETNIGAYIGTGIRWFAIALLVIIIAVAVKNHRSETKAEAKPLAQSNQPVVRLPVPWQKVRPFKHECTLRAGETSAEYHITPNHWAKLKVSDWGKPGIKFFVVYNGTKKLEPQQSGELPENDHVSYFTLVSDSLESILFTVEETPM